MKFIHALDSFSVFSVGLEPVYYINSFSAHHLKGDLSEKEVKKEKETKVERKSVLEAGFEPAHPKITELKSAALDQLGHPSYTLRCELI